LLTHLFLSYVVGAAGDHPPTDGPQSIGPFSSTALRDRFQRTLRDHEHRVAQLGPEAALPLGRTGL
jgi:hypothetical protein